jgi:hypothetical protein
MNHKVKETLQNDHTTQTMKNHKTPTHHEITKKSSIFNIKINHKTHNSPKTREKKNQSQQQKTRN